MLVSGMADVSMRCIYAQHYIGDEQNVNYSMMHSSTDKDGFAYYVSKLNRNMKGLTLLWAQSETQCDN